MGHRRRKHRKHRCFTFDVDVFDIDVFVSIFLFFVIARWSHLNFFLAICKLQIANSIANSFFITLCIIIVRIISNKRLLLQFVIS